MAIVMRTVCDVCREDDDNSEVEAETYTVTIHSAVGNTSGVFELCTEHQDRLSPVIDLLSDFGRDVREQPYTAPKRRGGGGHHHRKGPITTAELICPLCSFQGKNRQSIAMHAQRRHNVSLRELRAQGA